MKRVCLPAFLVFFLLLLGCGGGPPKFYRPATFVVGFDGMDPGLLRREMAAGRMPNFARLAKEGDFTELGTSLPPESPVAWANFATGDDPGGHGLFDFVARKIVPGGVVQHLSAADTVPASSFVPPFGSIFGYRIPLSAGRSQNLIRAPFFWSYLTRAGVPATIVRIPDDFPPRAEGARTFSGMGTPDLLGSYGTFSCYLERAPKNASEYAGKGEIHVVKFEGGVARSTLTGPLDTYEKPAKHVTLPVRIYPDARRNAARIDVGDESRVLRAGEWSGWVPVRFSLIPDLADAPAMVRLYLMSVHPIELYVSPVNIDPLDPVQPVSSPTIASRQLAEDIGRYYTQGMAEETNAARLRLFDTGQFLKQAWIVLREREKMLADTLDRFREKGGFTFFYFSSTDLCAHILFRTMDPKHPGYDPALARKYGNALFDIYHEMDRCLGEIMRKTPPGTRIIVMSDHGFAPLRRKFSLNTWLFRNGFLQLLYPDRQGRLTAYENVDWYHTLAYSVGFTGIYLNLEGRESTGLVAPGKKARRIEDQIAKGLLSVVDPKTGEHVVAHVYRRADVYHGAAAKDGPDLIVGYTRTYGSMDASVEGSVPRKMIEDNLDPWSGSHIMDPPSVPGILLANTKFRRRDPKLYDLAPTILKRYGIHVKGLRGKPIW